MGDIKYITIKGAKEHNLKNIDVKIPRDKFVVVTGLSGSGKSSLAFDTIYAEGQRRYMESLSSYARQFLGQAEKPDVEKIEGLSPAISIDQQTERGSDGRRYHAIAGTDKIHGTRTGYKRQKRGTCEAVGEGGKERFCPCNH